MILGLISVHAERLFADNEGPFSRRPFGLAFFLVRARPNGSRTLLGGGSIKFKPAPAEGPSAVSNWGQLGPGPLVAGTLAAAEGRVLAFERSRRPRHFDESGDRWFQTMRERAVRSEAMQAGQTWG